MKAVFDTKPTSSYDDDVSEHYHFPKRYLSIVEHCVGDWVVLRRPRADGGNLAYFAIAKVVSIEPDLRSSGMNYARFSEFRSFDNQVSWQCEGRYAEEALRNMPQREVGIYLRGRSVRPLTEGDFAELVSKGIGPGFDIGTADAITSVQA